MINQRLIKILVLALSLWLTSLSLTAAQIQPDQAMTAVRNFISATAPHHQINTDKATVHTYKNGKLTLWDNDRKSATEENLYFIMFADGNYAIVSADDNAYPVLAYSDEGMTRLNNLPPALNYWLDLYTAQINDIKTQKLQIADNQNLWKALLSGTYAHDAKQTREVVPLVTTMWNQDWPYNALCPQDSQGPGGRVYAGCVATAMGMVMKYWNHPQTGQGNHTYYASGYGYQSANFGATTYQWDQMGNSIGTNYLPIATLLYHCGVAVNMDYAPYGSGAQSTTAATSMVSYFRYPNAEYKSRSSYSQTTWNQLITTQIDNGVPLYYSGSGSGGGHAFVLDGYDVADHFHFNFGWSGSGNGYFYTNNINPSGSDFNQYQGVIVNTIPANYSINTIPVKLTAPNTTVGDNFNLTISTNPILGSWGINHYDLNLFYDNSNVQYIGYNVNNTISGSGNIVVSENTPGVISVNWNNTTTLSGGGDLIQFTFKALDVGDYLFDITSMNYNTTPVTNYECVMVNAVAPVATLAQSQISMTNIMHLAYNAVGTTELKTTYLLPSWNVTHFQTYVHFNPEKLAYTGFTTAGTLCDGLNLQATITEPGVLSLSCDTTSEWTGAGTLVKLQFQAIGNTGSLTVTQLTLSDFLFNDTAVTAVGSANVILSAYSSNEDEVVNTPPLSFSTAPNPFRDQATLSFKGGSEAAVKVDVYNLKGQLVNSFSLDNPSNRDYVWNGTDLQGRKLASGIYFLRWAQGSLSGSSKVLMLK